MLPGRNLLQRHMNPRLLYGPHRSHAGPQGNGRIPVPAEEKLPATQHGCRTPPSTADIISEWWRERPDCNVAVATGAASGAFVVDIDGLDAEAELRKLEAAHGPLPATVEGVAPRGRHVWFKIAGCVATQLSKQDRRRCRRARRRRLRVGAAEHPSKWPPIRVVS